MVHTSVKQTPWLLTFQKSPQAEIFRIKIKLENFAEWENSLLQTISKKAEQTQKNTKIASS